MQDQLLIGGQWLDGSDGDRIDVDNPATGAYVFTSDVGRGLNVSERLEYGIVGLNRGAMSDPAVPFGGMKQSGLGREGGSEGIYEFCETQYIAASCGAAHPIAASRRAVRPIVPRW